ncbi:tyrosine-type recombinase/integrase [Streptomyces sp. NPDC058092]|uniref:tyrosine-type recombinase/integrase n=1 Tax=Streptomyces sp. NPDC058092 TaxID=3346336 RepID=UPI0036EB7B79
MSCVSRSPFHRLPAPVAPASPGLIVYGTAGAGARRDAPRVRRRSRDTCSADIAAGHAERAPGIGLPERNPHDLRHKWTTVTSTSGMSLHEVSPRLGHRSVEVTVDRYGHLTRDDPERCRQVVEAAMAPHLFTSGRATSEPGADPVPARQASRRSRPRPYRF